MTRGYLLDTNHLSKAVAPGLVRKRIAALRRGGTRVGTCVPVLCEIEAGIPRVSKPDDYRAGLARLGREVRIWPMDQRTARMYGEIYQDLRQRGRVLSQIDMMIAAIARQMSLTVVTADLDFAALADIRTENWLAPAS